MELISCRTLHVYRAGHVVLNENDSYIVDSGRTDRRDLRRRLSHETLERTSQMRLIGVSHVVHHVNRRVTLDQQRQRHSARRICLIAPRVSPVARDTRRCTERVDRSFDIS